MQTIICDDKDAEKMNEINLKYPNLFSNKYPKGVKFINPPPYIPTENGGRLISNPKEIIQWLHDHQDQSIYLSHSTYGTVSFQQTDFKIPEKVDFVLYSRTNVPNKLSIRYVGYQMGPGYDSEESFISQCYVPGMEPIIE
jgi:hypothetical protein